MKNNAHGGARILLVLAAFLMAGCSNLGKDNILFVTKTSLGVDFDIKPPTLAIGFDRKEGTVAPRFESGEVLPQMAGFKSDLGIINQAVGQSFTTGTAAVLMSQYLVSDARPPLLKYIDIKKEILVNEGVTTGTEKNIKRYFFGTDTSFAFKVGFGLETGGLPDSLSLGYKRKELAFVPLADNDGKTVLPSLLATTDLATEASGPKKGKAVHVQFFATGVAASFLAALPEIRQSVAPKIMPDSALSIARAADLQQRTRALSAIICYEQLDEPDKLRSWRHMANLGLAGANAVTIRTFAQQAVDKDLTGPERTKSLADGERLYRSFLSVSRPLESNRNFLLSQHRTFACGLKTT